MIGLYFVYRRHLQGSIPADTATPLMALDSYSGNWRQAAFAQFSGAANQQLQDKPEDAPGPGVQHTTVILITLFTTKWCLCISGWHSTDFARLTCGEHHNGTAGFKSRTARTWSEPCIASGAATASFKTPNVTDIPCCLVFLTLQACKAHECAEQPCLGHFPA